MFPRSQVTAMNLAYMFFSFDCFLEDMEEMGFSKLELWGGAPHFYPDYMTPREIDGTMKKIAGHGMTCDIYTPEQCMYTFNIAAEAEDLRHLSLQYFSNALRVARDIGATRMLITPGWGYFDKPMDEAWARSVDSLWQLAEFGQQCGVLLMLEPLRVAESNLVTNLPRLSKMLSDVGHDNLVGMIDTIPMAQADESIIDYFNEIGSRLEHIHFIDGKPEGHLAWGDGVLPLGKYMDELETMGYKGQLTLEIVGDVTEPKAAFKRALETLAPYLDQSK